MQIAALSGWTSEQKHVVAASFWGWALDAFGFFLLVFVLKDIAAEFNTDITEVTFAILLTLAMRPIGAYLFGRAAEAKGVAFGADRRLPPAPAAVGPVL
jgi:MFS transporter, SHS family, lactate transporter